MTRALLLFTLIPGVAAAQLLSPGDLTRSHAHLEGMSNCTKCHGGGSQVSAEKCLACHKEVATRISEGKGLHGRIPEADRACENCHHDHQGKEASLIDWGGGGRKGFEHRRTGWPLTGAHVKVGCEQCHEKRFITAPDARKLLEAKVATWLGLPSTCRSCHFDEHRGQMKGDCSTCHDTRGWKPAPAFNHNKTDYPLLGKHARVACSGCHATQKDESTPANAFPAPKRMSFTKYVDIPHGRCTDCHQDPHQGKFGPRCESCHQVSGWKDMKKGTENRTFHDKTRFPLEGAHVSVACKSCHGPFPGRPAKFKGLAFQKCSDCHQDAHEGQIARVTCERCHSVVSFTPAKFTLADHAATKYPLEGGHQAVACSLCHPRDRTLTERVPLAVRTLLKREKRPLLVSLVRIQLPHATKGCVGCHADPHAGQFQSVVAAKGCEGCHRVSSFADLSFDHNRDSRFPLEGAHVKVPCAGCHDRTRRFEGKDVVIYKPLEMTCAACHRDIHLGQFASEGSSCEKCHTTESFKVTKFRHNDATFASFALEGQHTRASCEGCHPRVTVERDTTRRYKPVPQTCERCHADFHKGAFSDLSVAGKRVTGCASCHVVDGWSNAKFDHDSTGFPLRGEHQATPCKSCHLADFSSPIPSTCAGCHRDSHAGRLGTGCQQCHDEKSWQSAFGLEAHERTGFPLTGRHAVLPCIECHGEMRERTFSRAPRACVACHQGDFNRTPTLSVDHVAAGVPTECNTCHQTFAWSPARFPAHDSCFYISSGPHAGIRCLNCHSSLTGFVANGTCSTNTAACTSCHAHSEAATDPLHANLPPGSYQYRDGKCYGCHKMTPQ